MIFLDNKYCKWYFGIIDSAKNRKLIDDEYYESHHIIPKCLGGDNSPSNKVKLTGREHFICHFLLIKMLLPSPQRHKLVHAAGRMAFTANGKWMAKRYKASSKAYEIIRREMSASMSGKNHPAFGVKRQPMSDVTKAKLSASRRLALEDGSIAEKISASLKGRVPWNKGKAVMTDEQKARISAQHKGKVISEEQKQKMSLALTGRKNKPISEETREKQRLAALSRVRKPMPKREPLSEELKLKLKDIALSKKS